MESKDHLRDAWASLGVAFYQQTNFLSDPESALLDLVRSKEFPDDKKMMGLALLWLEHYSKLVHVERIKALAKKLSPYESAVLGAIASKCLKGGDHRWKAIVTMVKKSRQISHFPPSEFLPGDSELFIEMRGLDPEFNEFGIRIAPILPDDEKKLLPRNEMLKRNDWLKYRVLFGTNMRADIASVIILGLAGSAYAAAKLLGCSPNTAYRNWNDLEEAGWPGNFVKSV